jgi:hypothetical protein
MPGADVPVDHRKYAVSILSRRAKAPGSMWDLGNIALWVENPELTGDGISSKQVMAYLRGPLMASWPAPCDG